MRLLNAPYNATPTPGITPTTPDNLYSAMIFIILGATENRTKEVTSAQIKYTTEAVGVICKVPADDIKQVIKKLEANFEHTHSEGVPLIH